MDNILNKVIHNPCIRDNVIKDTIYKLVNGKLSNNELYRLSSELLFILFSCSGFNIDIYEKEKVINSSHKYSREIYSPTTIIIFGHLGSSIKDYIPLVINYKTLYTDCKIIVFNGGGIDWCENNLNSELEVLFIKRLNTIIDNMSNKTIIHVFSNNGMMTYVRFLKYLKESNNKYIDRIIGIIVDSAPQITSSKILLYKSIKYCLYKSLNPLGIDYKNIMKYLKPVIDNESNKRLNTSWLYEWLRKNEPEYNYLFLYSKQDKLINYNLINRYITTKRINNINNSIINNKLFTNSSHVNHMVMYERIYLDTIQKFLDEILSSTQGRACSGDTEPSFSRNINTFLSPKQLLTTS
tara:strand:+ start:3383 stop:4438 length:1056 start_codon:yes stop_codon:yes gene_type:complete